MKRNDLENAYAPVPEEFHNALLAAVREVKEERPMKKRHLSLLAALVIAALLCGTAVAVVNYYSVRDYQADSRPSAAFEDHVIEIGKTYENAFIKVVFGDTVFDGKKMALAMNLYSKDESKPVFLVPELKAFCGGRQLDVLIQGMRGLDEAGFLFPGLSGEEVYLENAYGLDADLTDADADSDITWVVTLRTLKPNWEIVDCAVQLHGDADDMPVDEYMQLFRDAYAKQKIMTVGGVSLGEYASVVFHGSEQAMYQALIECGAFTLVDTIEQTFTTPMPVIRTAKAQSFQFDDYSVTVEHLSASFMRAEFSLRHDYKTTQTDPMSARKQLHYEMRDQDGNIFNVDNSDGWFAEDGLVYHFTGEGSTEGQDISQITFIPFVWATEDEINVKAVYDEFHAFTVTLK